MSLIKELAGENMLGIALRGVRVVLERELEIKSVLFSLSETLRQELVRRVRETQKLEYPYSYVSLGSLAGMRDRQNNYAVQKHGMRFNKQVGDRATSKKGYTFPITLGLDFHYIDSDQQRLLNMAQALVILSLTDGLSFQIDVGDTFSIVVTLEMPQDATVNIQEEQNPSLPGASDITCALIMHAQIGFFRDVSAVNGSRPMLNISVGDTSFQAEMD